jgi:hypothetical protein
MADPHSMHASPRALTVLGRALRLCGSQGPVWEYLPQRDPSIV